MPGLFISVPDNMLACSAQYWENPRRFAASAVN
jgi:hypothetical protein